MWNDRFAGEDYVYGTEPADFLRREAGRLAPGARVLSVAEGEGRNAVWLAGQGMDVTAIDAAPNAVAKARRLARARGVEVTFHLADVTAWDWEAGVFDAVLGIFIQFAPPEVQAEVIEGMKRSTRPGGLVLLHGFAERQAGYGSGGPPNPAQLYTPDLLRARFDGFDLLVLRDYDAEIDEGRGHSGRAGLVDLVARRPA
ncbi:SAM-dependent methyltransferase [Rhodovulum iodosum]|uniref:SAM-dependent methyltransferase n=1 Tax=Rhodovulum iodosum TaxID=68291 RepID=A0ABV3XQB1_9RHOB|nr:class I SAM-dependent methyltransferase [Rhodovulum robiginosum]RSK31459.1 class I SAM-dependent methyltransferase [Rhodovulum robiginosum]